MNTQSGWRSVMTDSSFTTSRTFIGGVSTVGLSIIAVTIISASSAIASAEATIKKTDYSESPVKLDATVDDQLSADPAAPDYEDQTYSQSADGSSRTWQYRSSSVDDNDNQTTQDQTYTTNIDGIDAVDIKLDSNTTSTGSSNSSSSVNININSSSKTSVSNSQ